jgi:hypothetical protein
MPSKAVVIIVASFLVVALVCSSVTITLLPYDVFARMKHVVTAMTCDNVYSGGLITGTKCCYSTYDDDGVNISNYHDYCHNCDRFGLNCGPEYEVRQMGTTGGLIPTGNLTNAPPTGSNTGTSQPPVSVIKVPPGAIGNATNPSNNTVGTPPPPTTPTSGCGPSTDNSTCSTTSNQTQSTPTPTSGCGPGTDNSTCSTSTSNQSSATPPTEPGCGPGTDNSTCSSTTSNPPSAPPAPPTSGCGPGTDNSTCNTSTPNQTQSTHKGSNLGSSTVNGNNAIGSQITTNKGNSPTPPPCPDKGPIPPNCTMKPIIK